MNKQIIKEAALTAPTFNGSDEEIVVATNLWSSSVSAVSYVSSSVLCAENKLAIITAMITYLSTKMNEINNITPPPVVATTPPAFVPDALPAAVAQTPDACDAGTEVSFASYAESKKPVVKEGVSPILKRMRELAGIPHETNRV